MVDQPDASIATHDFLTPDWLCHETVSALEADGWSVFVDRFYAGTMATNIGFEKEPRCKTLMIEFDGAMYRD
jgi:hypothetical protein